MKDQFYLNRGILSNKNTFMFDIHDGKGWSEVIPYQETISFKIKGKFHEVQAWIPLQNRYPKRSLKK